MKDFVAQIQANLTKFVIDRIQSIPIPVMSWFIVSYDSANKQKHHESYRMQWTIPLANIRANENTMAQ